MRDAASEAQEVCRSCGEPLPAPATDEPETYGIVRPPEPKRRRRQPLQSHFVADAPVPEDTRPRHEADDDDREPLPAEQLDRQGLRRREALLVEEDPPPERTFFTNVFGFPWQGSVIGQWLFLSGGLAVFLTLITIIIALYQGAATMVSAVIAFIALPAFWIGAWTFSYAAACLLVIIQETAAGNNEIRDWMDPNWRDWAGQLAYVVYLATLPLAAAWPIVKLTGHTYSEAAIPLVVIEFLLFPYVLLSALEQDSMLLPFSGPVLLSTIKVPDGWLLFYLLSALVLAACGGATYAAILFAPLVAGLLLAPLVSACILIYARLLGRLGWLIVERGVVTEEDLAPGARSRPGANV